MSYEKKKLLYSVRRALSLHALLTPYYGHMIISSMDLEIIHTSVRAECIEWFVEDQTVSPLYYLAPPPPPPHFSHHYSKLDRRHTGRLRKRDSLLTGEGGGVGGGAKSYDSEKVWPSINHAILSVWGPLNSWIWCRLLQWVLKAFHDKKWWPKTCCICSSKFKGAQECKLN